MFYSNLLVLVSVGLCVCPYVHVCVCVLFSHPGLAAGSMIIGQMLKQVSKTPLFSIVKLRFFLQPKTSGPKLMSHEGVILYLKSQFIFFRTTSYKQHYKACWLWWVW